MTPMQMWVLGEGHAGPSLGEEPRTVFSLSQSARLRAGPQHEACAGKEGQDRGFRDGTSLTGGLRASLGRGLSAPVLPRSSRRGGHCPKDDPAIMICTRAGVFPRRSRACMSIKHGPGHLASRNELLFFPREPARGGYGEGGEEA